MVKVNAPAMSLDASGTLANALVFSKWKGRNYIRQHVTPANPQTGGQVGMRAMFRFLAQAWAYLNPTEQASWEQLAAASVISEFNAYMSTNQARWRNFRYPGQSSPVGFTGSTADTPVINAVGGIRQVELSWSCANILDNWGIMWFRSQTDGFDPAWTNAVIGERWELAAGGSFIDTPLAPGTYYYRAYDFTDDGMYQDLVQQRAAVVT